MKTKLTACKPKGYNYPINPKTLGEHIRKRRLDLDLDQQDLATLFRVSECTIRNWEYDKTEPRLFLMSEIIKFLGRATTKKNKKLKALILPKTLGGKIRKKRMSEKLTQKALAKILNVSVFAIRDWEHGRHFPRKDRKKEIERFLGDR